MSAAARSAGHVISYGITLSLMCVVIVFSLNSMRRRFRDRSLATWRKYGPLATLCVAVPFIMADLTRHLSQDGTFLIGDVLGIPLVIATIPCYIDCQMARKAKHWGPFNPPRGVPLGPGSRQFKKKLALFFAVAAAGIALLCCSHLKPTNSWYGAQQLQWQECGNNADYPRVNQTWDEDACFWSSSQFKCNLNCCVPEGEVAAGIPTPKGGFPQDDPKTFPKADKGACECHCCPLSDENLHHLAPMGVLFTMVFTYFGFFLLAVGMLWNVNIGEKLGEIRRQWRVLRGKEAPPSPAKKKAGKFKLSDQPVSPSVQDWMQSRTQCRGARSPGRGAAGGGGETVAVVASESGAPLMAGMVRYSSSQWCEGRRSHPQ